MNLLHLLFNKLCPDGAPNWLSIQFSKWKYSKIYRRNREFLNTPHIPIKVFEVAGAGKLVISQSPTSVTGQTAGFHLSISWSDGGLGCGGVLGLEEANRLAIHIIEQYSKQSKSEAELIYDAYSRIQNNPLITK